MLLLGYPCMLSEPCPFSHILCHVPLLLSTVPGLNKKTRYELIMEILKCQISHSRGTLILILLEAYFVKAVFSAYFRLQDCLTGSAAQYLLGYISILLVRCYQQQTKDFKAMIFGTFCSEKSTINSGSLESSTEGWVLRTSIQRAQRAFCAESLLSLSNSATRYRYKLEIFSYKKLSNAFLSHFRIVSKLNLYLN